MNTSSDQARAAGSGDLILGSIVDLAGVLRGKAVPAARLSSFTGPGLGASPSWNVFCADDALAFTPAFSVVGDLRLRIAEADLRDVGDGIRWAPAGFFTQDGDPAPVCTRAALQRMVATLAAAGLEAVVGHEIEFVLMDAVSAGTWTAYGVGSLGAQHGFVTDLLEAAARAELPIEQVHAEYGQNQFEVSVAPDGPVRAADNLVLARLLISRVARRHGLAASFSPMPVAGQSGNGAHQHVSLTQGGAPILSGGPGPHGITAEGGSAIGGLLSHLPSVMAVFASSPVSHLRLRPGMWSGVHCCWGLENREAALRLCAATAGNPRGAHLEVKPIDPSANPYLSSTAILGAALAGIRARSPLPAEVRVNPAELSVADAHASQLALLPTSPTEMLQLLATSSLATEIYGEQILQALLAVKEHDLATFAEQSDEATTERLRFVWSG